MKTTLPGFLAPGVCLVAVAFPAMAEEAVVKLPIDERPTLETFSKAGIRFQLPRSMELWNANDSRFFAPRGISLSMGDKVGVVLDFGGSASKAVAGCGISVNFAGKDLNAPGDTYPPRLPVTAETAVGSFQVRTPALSEAVFREWAGSCAALFKIDMTKTDAWFQNRLWENGASYLEIKHEAKDFRVKMSLVGPDEKQGRTDFSGTFSISWKAGDDPAEGGRPQRRAVQPPVQEGQIPLRAPGE